MPLFSNFSIVFVYRKSQKFDIRNIIAQPDQFTMNLHQTLLVSITQQYCNIFYTCKHYGKMSIKYNIYSPPYHVMVTSNKRPVMISIWQCAGLKKDLKAAEKCDKSGLVAEWSKAIVNHLYWVAVTTEECDEKADILEAKWLSLANHITNKHSHDNEHCRRCAHPRLKKGDQQRKYMKKGELLYVVIKSEWQ